MTVSLHITYEVGQLVTGFATRTALCGVHLLNLFWFKEFIRDMIMSSMYYTNTCHSYLFVYFLFIFVFIFYNRCMFQTQGIISR